MTRRAPLLALLLLAGCDSSPTITLVNTSAAEVNERINTAVKLNPGRWEGTIALANQPPKPIVVCLTESQLGSQNPLVAPQSGCSYDKFTLMGGKFDRQLTCEIQGMRFVSTASGTLDPDHYSATSRSEASGLPTGMPNAVAGDTKVDMKRTGECRGDEPKGP